MYDWKSQFTVQRRDFLKRTSERLAAMESILATIAQYPEEMESVRELTQHFHQLAGSSSIYELDKLGEIAASGERACLVLLRNDEGVGKHDWKAMKDMVQSMQFITSQHPDSQHDDTISSATAQQQQQESKSSNWTEAPTVSWPVGDGEQRSSGTWLVGNAPYSGSNAFGKAKDVLIVDGDQTHLLDMTRALEQSGMQVRGFRTIETAKKALFDRLPDALILNIPLIDGPGYDVAQALRATPDGHVPPILICSRQAGFLDKVMAIRSGADAFFNETADSSAIVKKLQVLFDRDIPNNYTILSVEDDPEQVIVIRSILESVGYKVQSISDPRQFEEALLATSPDLILLDVMLGPMSGFELARYVRSDDRYAATPIIFLTTQNQLNAHVESARVGGDEHLIKPVAPQLLISAVAGRLERYRILKKLIGRDGLTQFFTLATFMEAAEKALSKRYQGTESLVMLMLDVDDLEKINDIYGFSAGDRVLSALAKLLKAKIRNAEVFGRLGGDDFAVIVDNIDDRELAEIATQLIREFEGIEHEVNGQKFRATVSAGAASLDTNMNLKSWMSTAQIALKSAKSNGKNRVMKAKSRSGRY